MNSMVTYSRSEEEIKLMKQVLREAIADISEEEWDLNYFSVLSKMESYLENILHMDVACLDVVGKDGVEAIIKFRKRFQESFIMLIADVDLSPVYYMTPDIMAASLMLRPINAAKAKDGIKQLLKAYVRSSSTEEVYVIRSKEETYRIPVNQIICFESREKKIFVRTERQEIGFRDTLDHLSESLPDAFIRIHKSFIANGERIQKVVFSENIVYMDDNTVLPVSRSYKAELRERIKR